MGKRSAWISVVVLITFITVSSGFNTLLSDKKGVVHWHEEFNCTDFDVLNNMAWWYEYRTNINYLSALCPDTYENISKTYVPMVWGKNSNVNEVMTESNYILGFNEPNHVAQTNMTAEEAVEGWAAIESIANGKLLVSPSAAPCGSNCLGDRNEWFDSFFEKCKERSPPCKIDFLATHTYMCNANQVMRHLTNLSIEYQLPIWLTEFACGGEYTELENINFMKDILYRLENASFIFRYSWYKAKISEDHYVLKAASLLDPSDNGSLTNLGTYYNGFSGTEKVDGVWLNWGEWSNCGVSCGQGQMSRSRTCFYPDPSTTDLECIGDNSETKECNLEECQVDGEWGVWSEWSACGATCGEGQMSRSRKCLFQDPTDMGANCTGNSISYKSCNLSDCPGINTLLSIKKGVVHWHEEFNCTDFKVLNNMAWWYEYRTNINYLSALCPDTYVNISKTYVPMVWGKNSNVNEVMNESNYILGFNEPNHIGQTNITAEEAVEGWAAIESIANGKYLVSPSAAPCGSNCLGDRNEWFDSFFKKCKERSPPCKIHFLATHTYMCNANQVMRHLTNLSEEYQLPIWLTEFACGGEYTELENINFMKDILYRLENASFIFRYSWYKAKITEDHYVLKAASLLDSSGTGSLTNLGIYYNGFSGTEKVDGVWLNWGEWSNCGVSCGQGQMSRSRTCFYPDPLTTDLECIGDNSETKECDLGDCQGNTYCQDHGDEWNTWSQCSASCGSGTRTRCRVCLMPNGGTYVSDCDEEFRENMSCQGINCPVYYDCTWLEWSGWSQCSPTSGIGTKTREREYWYPSNVRNGNCTGSDTDSTSC